MVLSQNNKNICTNLLMIRPVAFGFNIETASSNAFQDSDFAQKNSAIAQNNALIEFDNFVEKLRNVGVHVTVIEDTPKPHTPDSIFPNNWISFHENGTLILYPMQAENRRLERRNEIIQLIEKEYVVSEIVDFSHYEKQEKFLEGTGSIVLDRKNKIAYACVSPRTDEDILEEFAETADYESVVFDAVDSFGKQIYHTNVLMCVADTFVVICMEAIASSFDRAFVKNIIIESGKKIIEISLTQMNHFAGNMLEVIGENNTKYLVMSTSAFNSLQNKQIVEIEKTNKILHSDLTMIEGNGGGSARCMMAEICLEKK